MEDDGDGANAQASNVHGAPHVTAPKGTTRWEAQAATASTTTTTRAATSTTTVLPAVATTTTAGLPFTLRSLAPLRQDAVTLSKVPPLSRHDATQSVAMSPSLSALAAAASGATHSASSGHFSSAAFGTTASQRISPLDHAIPALSPLSLPSLGGASRAMDVRPSSDSVTVARGHVRPPVSSHSLPNELPTEGTTVAPRPSPFAAGLFGDTNDDESDDDNNNIGTLAGLTVNGVVADCSAAAAATTTATSVSSISCHNASSFTTAAAANQAQTIVRHHDAQKLLRGATVSARDTPTNVRPFHFQSPSPDDTVLHAQSRTAHGTQIRTIHTSERQKLVQNSTKAAPSKIKSTMDPAIASAVRGIKQLSTGNVVGSTSGIAGKMDNER